VVNEGCSSELTGEHIMPTDEALPHIRHYAIALTAVSISWCISRDMICNQCRQWMPGIVVMIYEGYDSSVRVNTIDTAVISVIYCYFYSSTSSSSVRSLRQLVCRCG